MINKTKSLLTVMSTCVLLAEEGVTYDQEIIYDLFTNTIEAADELAADKKFRDHIAAMRDDLLKPAIRRWGQLKEWEEDKDDPKDKHRHVSHLFALFPGGQISMPCIRNHQPVPYS